MTSVVPERQTKKQGLPPPLKTGSVLLFYYGRFVTLSQADFPQSVAHSLPSALRLSTVPCTLAADSLMPASSTSVSGANFIRS